MTDREYLPVPRDPDAGLPARPLPYSYSGMADDPGGPGIGFSVRRLVRGVARYKWLVLALTLAGTTAAFFATRYLQLTYRAESRLWIEVAQRGDLMRGPIQSPELLENDAWLELLRSFAVYDHVVREQKLFVSHLPRDASLFTSIDIIPDALVPGTYALNVNGANGALELRAADDRIIERGRLGSVIGSSIGLVWKPSVTGNAATRTAEFTLMHPRQAAAQLDGAINARLAPGGNFMWVSYAADDPDLAARVTNAVAERYIAVAAELKRAKLDELRDILERQMQFAEKNLRDAELGLERFRVATITLPSDAAPVAAGLEATRAPVMSAFFELKLERETLQRDRAAIMSALSARNGTLSVDALSAVASVRQSPELTQAITELANKRAERRALLLQYTEEHPVVVRATADVNEMERQTVPALAQRLAGELGKQLAQLDNRVADASTELRQIPSRAIDEARYRREVLTAENLFNDLRQRYEAARLAAETTVPDVRMLDAATPPRSPALDERLKLMFAGFAGSLALGLLLAIGLDRMDPRLRYAEQVTDDMGLNIIGAIPRIATASRFSDTKRINAVKAATAGPHVVEALRAVRLNLMHAYGAAGPMIVTITSPGPGDGKTFMTSNLALSYSDLGMRVLVIDGDTRRGCMHRVFGTDRRPGLVDFLRSDLPLQEIVRSTGYPLLDLIPCGARTTNSPELLSSHLLGELLASIRGEYDVILIDSPPLGAGIDPLVLGSLAGNILLVMRTGNTDRAMAEAKLQMLDRLPVRVLGTVLNGFDSPDSYKYYSYMPGYESASEETMPTTNLLQRI
jgi:tyrosine-protein kinase Etk/Wzc